MSAGTQRSTFQWRQGLCNLAGVVLLILAASFVPADTSLSQLKKAGVLRVCVPPVRLPLITGETATPGYDAELLTLLSERIGVRLSLRPVPAMNSDFNPRNWGLNRGMCEAIAGGIVDTPETRNFLQIVPTGAMTGWAIVAKGAGDLDPGGRVAVLAMPGLDRLAASRFLHTSGQEAVLVRDTGELADLLAQGAAQAALTDLATAKRVAAMQGLTTHLPRAEGMAPRSFGVGIWKGDLTLRRALARAMQTLQDDGTLTELRARYGLAEAPALQP